MVKCTARAGTDMEQYRQWGVGNGIGMQIQIGLGERGGETMD